MHYDVGGVNRNDPHEIFIVHGCLEKKIIYKVANKEPIFLQKKLGKKFAALEHFCSLLVLKTLLSVDITAFSESLKSRSEILNCEIVSRDFS